MSALQTCYLKSRYLLSPRRPRTPGPAIGVQTPIWKKVDGYSWVDPIVQVRHTCYNINVYLFLVPRGSPHQKPPKTGTRADEYIPYIDCTVCCCRPHTSPGSHIYYPIDG